ncbi:YitT family protein [Anaeromassilibacillus senegalensis]|uniref:YitT family protein n=1 Tax=Anaeromassilibacillus senegalensis TaxID=1673717 RepID=UPI000A5A89EF|nr:YitT family protein [Anaeromassilibacillus senegalensis]
MLQKLTRKRTEELAKDLLFFLAGSLIYSVSVKMFTAPNHIASGGVTGVSIVLNYLFGTPIGTMAFIINIPIFIWAIIEIGYKLVAKTFVATLLSSLAIDMMGVIIPPYEGNPMLAAIFGGVLEGVGLSLVFMRGGTTGGTDMVARLLGRHFRHLSMGKLMLGVDFLVIVFSGFAFRSIESALYAMLTIFVSTRLIDSILYGTDMGNGKVLFIMSEKNKEIAQTILRDLDRGVTALKSRGVYSGREGEVLLCAVRRYEVCKVNDIVHSADPNAFIIVGEAGEITGEGFREVKPEDKPLKEILAEGKKHLSGKKEE